LQDWSKVDASLLDLAPPDPRTLAEPVDIVSNLPSSLKAGLTSSKWKERKEILDELLTLVKASPRIKDASEFGELSRSLATCIQKDANINCVMAAAGCMEGLAKGVMAPFGRYRESVVGPMLERLKERKASVTDSIAAALDAVFSTVSFWNQITIDFSDARYYCLLQTTLTDIIPDILPAIVNKNPQVKEGSLKYLNRCLSTSTMPLPPSQLKSVADPLSTLLEDGFAGARDEAATCLGTLMKMVGERPLNALVDGLADVRKAKVKEAYEKATVKCKAGTGAPPAKGLAGKKAVLSKKDIAIAAPEDEPPKKPAAKPQAKAVVCGSSYYPRTH
jgi:cytoskeleton-associated protein 5